MDRIKIMGLRSLYETDNIELKPLTLALGKNSSGKSTLMRTFPLIKQTLETKVSEPLLWYGRYVDFGDFNQSINRLNENNTISFCFNIFIPLKNFREYDYFSIEENGVENKQISIFITIDKEKIESTTYEYDNNTIKICYDLDENISSFTINGTHIHEESASLYEYRKFSGRLLPELVSNNIIKDNKTYRLYVSRIYRLFNINDVLINFIKRITDIHDDNIISYLYSVFPTIINEKEISTTLPFTFFSENLSNKDKDSVKKGKRKLQRYCKDHKNEVDLIMLYTYMPIIIRECNDYLSEYFQSTSYMAPIRATAERYYRNQGLDIQDVDARGDNVPMILKSMKGQEKEQFNTWLEKNFDFRITTEGSSGHISIFIEKEHRKVNIADTGFGYSQILPIILLVWKNTLEYYSITGSPQKNKMIKQIIIEQPELHLHPKMQSQLIEVIAHLATTTNNVRFLIETHSETIINHLGRMIEEKKLDNKKINVLLFNQNIDGISEINQIQYSENGYLKEWPIDFFQDGE